jgi:hypothetical protein
VLGGTSALNFMMLQRCCNSTRGVDQLLTRQRTDLPLLNTTVCRSGFRLEASFSSNVPTIAFEALGNNGWNAKSIFKSIRQVFDIRYPTRRLD